MCYLYTCCASLYIEEFRAVVDFDEKENISRLGALLISPENLFIIINDPHSGKHIVHKYCTYRNSLLYHISTHSNKGPVTFIIAYAVNLYNVSWLT